MKAGRFTGMSEHYNEKGQLVKSYGLIDGKIKDGIYKEFYENGNVSWMSTYKMDTLVGYEYYFKKNRDTIKYYVHDQGRMDFPYKMWLADGRVVYGVHLKGEKVLWTWYDKKGYFIKKEIVTPSKSGYPVPH